MRTARRIQLGVVARRIHPRARKVVRHQIDEVEVLRGRGEVDVLQGPLPRRQGRREQEHGCGKVSAQGFEEEDKVTALERVGRVFPVDCIFVLFLFSFLVIRSTPFLSGPPGGGGGMRTINAVEGIRRTQVSGRMPKLMASLCIGGQGGKWLGALSSAANGKHHL